MTGGTHKPDLSSAQPQGTARLESWKEIANYLSRTVRTVQRWEKEENLPIHRHMHDKLGTVYAFKPELDAWWQNGQPRLEQEEQEELARTLARRRRLFWPIAAAAVALAAVVAGGLAWWLTRPPALPFEERDWVLIADFVNTTGDSVFDGTLKQALAVKLKSRPSLVSFPSGEFAGRLSS